MGNSNEVVVQLENIDTLRQFTPSYDGQVVTTLGHSKLGLGAGTYVFEENSNKPDNNGAWIKSVSSNGTWILKSRLTFENFGVIDNGLDQSINIQACLDFAHSQKIFEISFEKRNIYYLSSSIVIKPILNIDISTFYATDIVLQINTNGTVFKPLNSNLTLFKIHRERVSFDMINIHGNNKSNITGIQLGLNEDDEEYNDSYRRSTSFFYCGKFYATSIKNGVKFCPWKSLNGFTYSNYYHNFDHISFRDVMVGLFFDVAVDGNNQTTRSSIGIFNHNGGACSILGLNCESLIVNTINAENLKNTYSDFPECAGYVVYIPKIGNGMNMPNHSIKINGCAEDVAKGIFSEANRSEIDISIAQANSIKGFFNSGFGGYGSFVPFVDDPNKFVFTNNHAKTASLGIARGATGAVNLPKGLLEAYGNILWLPSSAPSSEDGIQVLTLKYPFESMFLRKTSYSYITKSYQFGEWLDILKPVCQLQQSNIQNIDCNTLKTQDQTKRFWGYSLTLGNDPVALNAPVNEKEFYGAIEWIPTLPSQGVQIAYGTYPNITRKRTFNGSQWSPWSVLS